MFALTFFLVYAEKIIDVIRENDPNNIIVVGTPNYSYWLDKVTERINRTNIAYTLHYYAASTGTNGGKLYNITVDAYNNYMPIFVTEYGTCEASGNGVVDPNLSNHWWQLLDNYKISYINWCMGSKNESSNALIHGSLPQDIGTSSKWSTSGKLVNAKYQSTNQGVSC